MRVRQQVLASPLTKKVLHKALAAQQVNRYVETSIHTYEDERSDSARWAQASINECNSVTKHARALNLIGGIRGKVHPKNIRDLQDGACVYHHRHTRAHTRPHMCGTRGACWSSWGVRVGGFSGGRVLRNRRSLTILMCCVSGALRNRNEVTVLFPPPLSPVSPLSVTKRRLALVTRRTSATCMFSFFSKEAQWRGIPALSSPGVPRPRLGGRRSSHKRCPVKDAICGENTQMGSWGHIRLRGAIERPFGFLKR